MKNKIIENKGKFVCIALLIIGTVVVSIFYKSINPICPDDFEDSKQRIASFAEWVKEFDKENPNATNSDLSKARRDFYAKNNCKESLKRYDDFLAGNIDKETKQLVEMAINEEVIKNQRIPICPNEYKNQEDYINATRQWLSDFYDKNPDTTKDEMLSARKDFLIKSNCKEF